MTRAWTPIISFILLLATPVASSKPKKKKPNYDKFIKNYVFVNDFTVKPERRSISDELFWRYKLKLPKPSFGIEYTIKDIKKELPQTIGDGRPYMHINYGRTEYLKGDYKKAKKIWLSNRARYGKTYDHHRRNDYFLGLVFLALANQYRKQGQKINDVEYKGAMSNATTFLAWAFLNKTELKDPEIDKVMPKQLYNLAAIYFRYRNYGAAYGAAAKGLEFLRKTGRSEYRPKFRRILAEAFIKNRDYLQAMQQFDQALRQDPNPIEAAAIFARVADIYYALNNFELAEELYDIAIRIDEEAERITPAQFVLRGESLFWLGKYSDAQKMFHYGLEIAMKKDVHKEMSPRMAAVARLRIADSYMALKKYRKAEVEYFKVLHNHRGSREATFAKIRHACLGLPYFKGNNIKHARNLLESLKNAAIPYEATELAWACQVGSYAKHERTKAMVERVKEFAKKFPKSRFLKSLIEPVLDVKISQLEEYFSQGKIYEALSYFEKTRHILFKTVEPKMQRRIFNSYLDTNQTKKAIEFWKAHNQSKDTDLKLIRRAAASAEMYHLTEKQIWKTRNKTYAKKIS